jgi:hypothetical protein
MRDRSGSACRERDRRMPPRRMNNKEYNWFCMKGTIGKRIESDSACREG